MRKAQMVLSTIVSFFIGFVVKSSNASSLEHEIRNTERGLAYVRVENRDAKVRILFIHGSPGSHHAYNAYLANPSLSDRAELIAVDRLGYGHSSPSLVSSLEHQAAAIRSLLDSSKANILVGHSLGGPIALELALQHPSLVNGLVLVAPAIDPQLEEPKWYNLIADTWLVNWALSRDWKTSNGEMMPLSNELARLTQRDWGRLEAIPITIVHGLEDTIADPKNSTFAIKRLDGDRHQLLEVEKEGHFILWQNAPFIVQQIQGILDQLN